MGNTSDQIRLGRRTAQTAWALQQQASRRTASEDSPTSRVDRGARASGLDTHIHLSTGQRFIRAARPKKLARRFSKAARHVHQKRQSTYGFSELQADIEVKPVSAEDISSTESTDNPDSVETPATPEPVAMAAQEIPDDDSDASEDLEIIDITPRPRSSTTAKIREGRTRVAYVDEARMVFDDILEARHRAGEVLDERGKIIRIKEDVLDDSLGKDSDGASLHTTIMDSLDYARSSFSPEELDDVPEIEKLLDNRYVITSFRQAVAAGFIRVTPGKKVVKKHWQTPFKRNKQGRIPWQWQGFRGREETHVDAKVQRTEKGNAHVQLIRGASASILNRLKSDDYNDVKMDLLGRLGTRDSELNEYFANLKNLQDLESALLQMRSECEILKKGTATKEEKAEIQKKLDKINAILEGPRKGVTEEDPPIDDWNKQNNPATWGLSDLRKAMAVDEEFREDSWIVDGNLFHGIDDATLKQNLESLKEKTNTELDEQGELGASKLSDEEDELTELETRAETLQSELDKFKQARRLLLRKNELLGFSSDGTRQRTRRRRTILASSEDQAEIESINNTYRNDAPLIHLLLNDRLKLSGDDALDPGNNVAELHHYEAAIEKLEREIGGMQITLRHRSAALKRKISRKEQLTRQKTMMEALTGEGAGGETTLSQTHTRIESHDYGRAYNEILERETKRHDAIPFRDRFDELEKELFSDKKAFEKKIEDADGDPEKITKIVEEHQGQIERIQQELHEEYVQLLDLEPADRVTRWGKEIRIQVRESLKHPVRTTGRLLNGMRKKLFPIHIRRDEHGKLKKMPIGLGTKRLADRWQQIEQNSPLSKEWKGVEKGAEVLRDVGDLAGTLGIVCAIGGFVFPPLWLAVVPLAITSISARSAALLMDMAVYKKVKAETKNLETGTKYKTRQKNRAKKAFNSMARALHINRHFSINESRYGSATTNDKTIVDRANLNAYGKLLGKKIPFGVLAIVLQIIIGDLPIGGEFSAGEQFSKTPGQDGTTSTSVGNATIHAPDQASDTWDTAGATNVKQVIQEKTDDSIKAVDDREERATVARRRKDIARDRLGITMKRTLTLTKLYRAAMAESLSFVQTTIDTPESEEIDHDMNFTELKTRYMQDMRLEEQFVMLILYKEKLDQYERQTLNRNPNTNVTFIKNERHFVYSCMRGIEEELDQLDHDEPLPNESLFEEDTPRTRRALLNDYVAARKEHRQLLELRKQLEIQKIEDPDSTQSLQAQIELVSTQISDLETSCREMSNSMESAQIFASDDLAVDFSDRNEVEAFAMKRVERQSKASVDRIEKRRMETRTLMQAAGTSTASTAPDTTQPLRSALRQPGQTSSAPGSDQSARTVRFNLGDNIAELVPPSTMSTGPDIDIDDDDDDEGGSGINGE